jgi:hypothetical protein
LGGCPSALLLNILAFIDGLYGFHQLLSIVLIIHDLQQKERVPELKIDVIWEGS